MKISIYLHICFLDDSIPLAENSFPPCGENGWVAYKDEKCFKIFPNEVRNRDEAEGKCKEERFQSIIPSLVIIKSEAEQEFLNNLIFNTSGSVDNVWIGAKRNSDNKTFIWEDESEIEFSNWSEGSPSEDVERNCVQMDSQFANLFNSDEKLRIQSVEGVWSDVPCKKRNLVLCQKMQVWYFPQLQYEFLVVRKELTDARKELVDTKKELGDTKKELGDTKKELGDTKKELGDTRKKLNKTYLEVKNLKTNPGDLKQFT